MYLAMLGFNSTKNAPQYKLRYEIKNTKRFFLFLVQLFSLHVLLCFGTTCCAESWKAMFRLLGEKLRRLGAPQIKEQ